MYIQSILLCLYNIHSSKWVLGGVLPVKVATFNPFDHYLICLSKDLYKQIGIYLIGHNYKVTFGPSLPLKLCADVNLTLVSTAEYIH